MDGTTRRLSRHARERLQQRAVCLAQLELALDWGRAQRLRGGLTLYFVGRRDVRYAAERGIDLSPALRVAVIAADNGTVVTVLKAAKPPARRKACRPPRRWGEVRP